MVALIGELGAQISGALRPFAALEERERVCLETLEERERGRDRTPVPLLHTLVKPDLRCPTYDWTTENEGFVEQFTGVARLAQWPAEVWLLQHLWEGAGLGPNPTK